MLGAGVAKALAARGDTVTVLQRRPSGLGLPEVLADVSDAIAVGAAVRDHEAVVHLAAKVNVTGPWPEYERINITGTRTVVEACRTAGVQRLVHVSSPSVAHAGRALIGVGAAPADPIRARGPYARSKAVAEQIALGGDAGDLAVLAIRPHLVWGPGDPMLVARVVDRARRGRLPVIGSGAALLDSTYVTNAVDALVVALDRCVEARGQALVVTNGEPRPITELVGSICAAAGVPPPTRRSPDSSLSRCPPPTGSTSAIPARSCSGARGSASTRDSQSLVAGFKTVSPRAMPFAGRTRQCRNHHGAPECAAGDQPLTAPMVKPAMNRSRNRLNTKAMGNATSTVAA